MNFSLAALMGCEGRFWMSHGRGVPKPNAPVFVLCEAPRPRNLILVVVNRRPGLGSEKSKGLFVQLCSTSFV